MKHLDVLLDVAWLRVPETHNDLEELLTLGPAFADGCRAKPFEVSADAIFLVNTESVRRSKKLLEQMDCVDRRDVARLLLFPPYAADAYAVRRPFRHAHGFEAHGQHAPGLLFSEQHQPALVLPLFLCP